MSALPFVTELIIRTALIALGTAAVLWMLRIRTASVRHAAWAAVVVAMLVLPVLQVAQIRMSLPLLAPAPEFVTTNVLNTVTMPSQDSAVRTKPDVAQSIDIQESPASSSAPSASPIDWRAVLFGGYVAGALLLLLRLVIGTLQANRLRRTAGIHEGRLTSDRCVTPITAGWLTPVLIFPSGWEEWPAEQLAVVLTHEQEHARRKDPLWQWLALLNRAVFWFHPLAWWLERRLATLAEEACDAAVLAAGQSPQDYYEYLVAMARTVSRQHGRVRLVGMAMPGAGLSGRLRLILRGLPSARVSRARLVCTVAFCTVTSVIFAAGTLSERAQQKIESQRPSPNEPTVALRASAPTASNKTEGEVAAPARAQSAGVPAPITAPDGSEARPQNASAEPAAMQVKFEAVSIKPCLETGESGGRGGGGGMRNAITPGYASWGCVTLSQLIDQAYGGGPFPNNSLQNTVRRPPGEGLNAPKRIRGGPSWVESERFAIEIRLSGDVTNLTGSLHHNAVLTAMAPALRALLEDRFQLKLHKATEEQRMYALTAPGFNLTVSAPEKCWKPEDYPRPPGLSRMEVPPPPAGWEGIPACGYQANGGRVRGNESLEFTHITLSDLAKWLSREMDRYVLDRTNKPGRFTFRLEFAPDESTPGIIESNEMFARAGAELLRRTPPAPVKGDGPTIFKALETLGLKLEPTRGTAEFLQIDSAQRPKSDGPAFALAALAGLAGR